jgi:hypothetical protein
MPTQENEAIPYYYGMNYDAPEGPPPAPVREIGSLLGGAILKDTIGVDSGLWYQNIMGTPLNTFQIDFGGPTREGETRGPEWKEYGQAEAWGKLADVFTGPEDRMADAMMGRQTYTVDEINTPRTVALKQAEDTLKTLMQYAGPGFFFSGVKGPSATTLGLFAGKQAKEAPVSMQKVAEVALAAGKHPDEVWKGALVEIGAALALGRPVYVIGLPPGSWVYHPLVRGAKDVIDALRDFTERSEASLSDEAKP